MMKISTTEKLSFKSCRARWNYSSHNRHNLVSKSPQKHLFLGTGVHKALEMYYKRKDDLVTTFKQWYKEESAQYLNASVEIQEEMQANLELGIGMLEHYAIWAPKNDKFTVIATEFEFEMELQPGIMYVGKLDGLVRDEHDKIWVLEHKTFSRPIEANMLMLDEQTTAYQWIVDAMIENDFFDGQTDTNERCRGVIYNGLKKKLPTMPKLTATGNKLSEAKNSDTTYDYYHDAILAHGFALTDYRDMLNFLENKGNSFFYRDLLRRTKVELELFEKRLDIEVQEMIDPVIYHTPSKDCAFCPFFSPCYAAMSGGDEEAILASNFQQAKSRGTVYGTGASEE